MTRKPAVVVAVASLLAVGLVVAATGQEPPAPAPDAPAPVAPDAPSSPGGGVSGNSEIPCSAWEGPAARLDPRPVRCATPAPPAPPPPPETTTTTTIPYTNCIPSTEKPNVVVVPQDDTTLTLDGRLADYEFPEAAMRDGTSYFAKILYGLEGGRCIQVGQTFQVQVRTGDFAGAATGTTSDVRIAIWRVRFPSNGYYGEATINIIDNDDDIEHAYAQRDAASHMRGSRPGCVEWVEVIGSTDERTAARNALYYGTIEPALIAIVGNMPHCEGRY